MAEKRYIDVDRAIRPMPGCSPTKFINQNREKQTTELLRPYDF